MAPTNGGFLPSGIPAAGQPFYGTGERASVQGNGSNVSLAGKVVTANNSTFEFYSSLFAQSLGTGSGGTTSSPTFSVQQIYGQLNKILVGQAETSLATIDNTSLPETLDFAGPNARVTVLTNGTTGPGQGRLSYFLLNTHQERTGFTAIVSAEQATPEITAASSALGTTGTFSRVPDFIGTLRYGSGQGTGSNYIEDWHLQCASIIRSLGVENGAGALKQTTTGWGVSLSGAARFSLNPRLTVRDGVFYAATYGEGLGHYILDLHGSGDDAALNPAGSLVALPVFAAYVGYTHNWSDYLRSTLTYSHVSLSSLNSPGQTASPYRFGDYVAINLLYHDIFFVRGDTKNTPHVFYTGFEFLYGQKQVLSGAEGEGYRGLWVFAFTT